MTVYIVTLGMTRMFILTINKIDWALDFLNIYPDEVTRYLKSYIEY